MTTPTRQRRQLIAWQEELDWQIYEAFGLVEGAAASGPAAVSLPEGEAMGETGKESEAASEAVGGALVSASAERAASRAAAMRGWRVKG